MLRSDDMVIISRKADICGSDKHDHTIRCPVKTLSTEAQPGSVMNGGKPECLQELIQMHV